MSEVTTGTATRSQKRAATTADKAMELGGKILEVAFTGLVLGLTGAIGQRLVSGSSSSARIPESETNVTPLKRVGNA